MGVDKDKLFHSGPAFALGWIERGATYIAGIITYAVLRFWLVWPDWLSLLCALCAVGLTSIGAFVMVGAIDVWRLKRRGLTALGDWPDDVE